MNNQVDGLKQDSKFSAIVGNKCPNCYQGSLYQKYLVTHEICHHCKFQLDSLITGDGPAVLVMFLASTLATSLSLIAYFIFDLPTIAVLIVWVVSTISFSLVSLPWLKTVMIFLEYSQYKDER